MKKFIALIMLFFNIAVFGNWLIIEEADTYDIPTGVYFGKTDNYEKHIHLEYHYFKTIGRAYIIQLNEKTSKEIEVIEADNTTYTNIEIYVGKHEFKQRVLYNKEKRKMYITKAQLGTDFDLLYTNMMLASADKNSEIKVVLSNGMEIVYGAKNALTVFPMVDYYSK